LIIGGATRRERARISGRPRRLRSTAGCALIEHETDDRQNHNDHNGHNCGTDLLFQYTPPDWRNRRGSINSVYAASEKRELAAFLLEWNNARATD